MTKRSASLEKAIYDSIRGNIRRLPWRAFTVRDVSHYLAKEVIDNIRTDKGGRVFAPDQYTMSIHPMETGELQKSPPEIQEDLAMDVKRALEAEGFFLAREPHITLATDPTLSSGEVRVIAWHSSAPSEFEADLVVQPPAADDQPPRGAFLVVEGKRHFPLNKPVVTIGRLPDNDLVLGDPHVSRRHAQLLAEGGGYKIIDLDSTAGTRVSGRVIKEHLLKPGDLITIATIDLIYGEDPGGPPDATPPYEPAPRPPSDRHQITPLDLKQIRDDKTESLEGSNQ